MFFTDKWDLISLNFKPRQACFSKARVEWKGIVLNNLDNPDQPIIDLSDQDIHELIVDLFGTLSFIELAELMRACMKQQLHELDQLDWPRLLELNGFVGSERHVELLKTLSSMPASFHNWAFERKLAPKELMPLNSLLPDLLKSHYWDHFLRLSPTRSEGRLLIDLIVDLILIKKSLPLPPTSSHSAADWLKELGKVRYPQQTQRDQNPADISIWPQFVKVQTLRQGDRLVHKMQIDFYDLEDLQKKLDRLQLINFQQQQEEFGASSSKSLQ